MRRTRSEDDQTVVMHRGAARVRLLVSSFVVAFAAASLHCSSSNSTDDDDPCAPGDADGINGGQVVLAVTVDDTAFSPAILKVQNLASISLTVTNKGTKPHDFAVDCMATPNDLGCPTTSCFPTAASIPSIAPGASATTSFATPNPEGIYVFRSNVAGDNPDRAVRGAVIAPCRSTAVGLALALTIEARTAHAQSATPSDDEAADSVVVRAPPRVALRGVDDITVRRDFAHRIVLRQQTSEMLSAAPGFFVDHEDGEGLGNDVYLRGFDLDHGSGIEMRVGSIPINVPLHIEGQGYADANFIVPEVVRSVRVIEGPYDPRQGDAAIVGSAYFDLGAPRARLPAQNDGRLLRASAPCWRHRTARRGRRHIRCLLAAPDRRLRG